jgi:hypothetical protein
LLLISNFNLKHLYQNFSQALSLDLDVKGLSK